MSKNGQLSDNETGMGCVVALILAGLFFVLASSYMPVTWYMVIICLCLGLIVVIIFFQLKKAVEKDLPQDDDREFFTPQVSANSTPQYPEFAHANQRISKPVNGLDKSQSKEESALRRLESLIGLEEVKAEVRKLSDLVKVQQMRRNEGLKSTTVSYHCVFTGNPGRGKTTVARIIADIYNDLGILRSGHLIETDRSGLVGEYVGTTAIKTNKVVDSAIDGVLFIDEAYSLAGGGNEDYGKEAIATLLKRMEDDRDRLVVILAGYSDEIRTFIETNPGLKSRFNRYIHFSDYSAPELQHIFMNLIKKNDYIIEEEAVGKLSEILDDAVRTKDSSFGNARFVRNLFEKVMERQASRLAAMPVVDKDALQIIKAVDILI